MNGTENKNLHMVKANLDEIREKVRIHRRKQWKKVLIIASICVAAILVFYFYMQGRTYNDYKVTDRIERTDTEATKYTEFNGNILKYSNDGVSYTDKSNNTIWTQSYEMQDPVFAQRGSYAVFADRDGKDVYVFNSEGLQGKFSTDMAIQKIDIASKGTVAALMQNNDVSYIGLYNKDGEKLAEGAIHIENSGYPLDIALSSGGDKLGVSILDIKDGSSKTILNFYNFSSAGQKKIDNIVSTFSYKDTVIPDIEYEDNDRMLAFADHAVYVFAGNTAPAQKEKISVPGDIKSVFYNRKYFGIVLDKAGNSSGYKMKLYSSKGNLIRNITLDLAFDEIGFLSNGEVYLLNGKQCAIYTQSGVEKFKDTLEEPVQAIMYGSGFRNYYFIFKDKTDQVRFSLFHKKS